MMIKSNSEQFVGVCHWSSDQLIISSDLSKIILANEQTAPAAAPLMSLADALELPAILPFPTPKSSTRGSDKCPCTEGCVCKDDMKVAGTKVHPPGDVPSSWYDRICTRNLKERQTYAKEKTPVHKRHFAPDDIIVVPAAFKSLGRRHARAWRRVARLWWTRKRLCARSSTRRLTASPPRSNSLSSEKPHKNSTSSPTRR